MGRSTLEVNFTRRAEAVGGAPGLYSPHTRRTTVGGVGRHEASRGRGQMRAAVPRIGSSLTFSHKELAWILRGLICASLGTPKRGGIEERGPCHTSHLPSSSSLPGECTAGASSPIAKARPGQQKWVGDGGS